MNHVRKKSAHPPLVVEVGGDYACFTRPEFKAERFSYEIITPSAACGVLESIFWKPEFQYVITRIDLLREIKWMSVRRNEVDSTTSLAWVQKAASDPSERFNAEEHRDQRNTVLLRDVGYRIYAQMELAPHADANIAKYRDQFRRRVERGACFSEPYLGMREFSATFGPATLKPPYPETKDLGVMLHSIAHTDGQESYQWFRAFLNRGVMDDIPPEGSPLSSSRPVSGQLRGTRC
jgi:CRISPR-associated protein Cas5d